MSRRPAVKVRKDVVRALRGTGFVVVVLLCSLQVRAYAQFRPNSPRTTRSMLRSLLIAPPSVDDLLQKSPLDPRFEGLLLRLVTLIDQLNDDIVAYGNQR